MSSSDSTGPTGRSARGATLFLVLASAGLAALVVVLGLQNRGLKRALAQERAAAHAPPSGRAPRFQPGDRWPDFALLDGGGLRVPVAFDGGSDTLLLFHAEACTVCPQAFAKWEELAPLFADAGARVLAVQLDRTPATEPGFGPPGLASHALADVGTVPLDKLSAVPLTLLLDGRGVVRHAHYGTLTLPDMEALVALLPRGS